MLILLDAIAGFMVGWGLGEAWKTSKSATVIGFLGLVIHVIVDRL